MPYTRISTFRGLNTRTDQRRLKPNDDKEGMAESPNMENFDITVDGALVTSTGFELVSSGPNPDTAPVLNLQNYEKDDTNRYLIITYDNDHYSITPSNSTWSTTNLGSYGTATDIVGGTVYLAASGDRKVILGNNLGANNTKKADISGAMADAGAGAPDGYIMVVFMGRLFTASGTTLSYSAVDDETALSSSVSFNDIITGLAVEGKRLTVFTRSYHQGIVFEYNDSFAISTPLKEPYEREYGCLAFKTVVRVYPDIFYWADEGVIRLGDEVNYSSQGLPRPQSLSRNIDPSLDSTNRGSRVKATAVHLDQKYYLAVPNGTDTYNSRTFIFDIERDAWILRTGFYPADFETFRDSNYKKELYFGDSFGPNLYKFNSDYSYNGEGYTRKWVSKKFTHGDNLTFKRWRWIDITGSMDEATNICVTLTVDEQSKTYNIDNTHLELSTGGAYIGDNFLGDSLLGGPLEDSRFKRFKARIPFNADIREGYEMQITIQNDGVEQPFKVDFIGIEYDYRVRTQIADKFINNQPKVL